MKLHLRGATDADADTIATILIRTRAEFMPYAPSVHPESEVRAWVRAQLVPSGGVTVVEHTRSIVGVMAVSSSGGCSWLTQMAVTPERVGMGVGSALLAHALAALPPPIRLHTFQANGGARRFYERHGFVAIEFTDGHANEERCPDVLYEYPVPRHTGR